MWLKAALWWSSLFAVFGLTVALWNADAKLPLPQQRNAGWFVCPVLAMFLIVLLEHRLSLPVLVLGVYALMAVLCYALRVTRDQAKGHLIQR